MRYIFFLLGHITSRLGDALREEWLQDLAYKAYNKLMYVSLKFDEKHDESNRIWKKPNAK